MRTTDVKIVMRMAEDAAFYFNERGLMFRMNSCDTDAETFMVTDEDSGEVYCIAAHDVSDKAVFFRLEQINKADYEDN